MKSLLALSAAIALSLVAAPAFAEQPYQSKKAPAPVTQPYQPKAQAPAPKQDPKPAQGRMSYRGNPKSGIYHNSNCKFFDGGPDSVFIRGAADAKAKGYRACKVCGGAEPIVKPEPKAQPKPSQQLKQQYDQQASQPRQTEPKAQTRQPQQQKEQPVQQLRKPQQDGRVSL